MDSPSSTDFARFLAQLTREFRDRDIPMMLIGGQAVLLHGRPRLTEDIDVTLGVAPDALAVVMEACRALSLDPLPADPESFARETFVLPAAHRRTRQRVDLIFSTTPYERQAIERADRVELADEQVPFATAEDLILHKLFAGRPRDIEDVESVVRRQRNRLDWSYLADWAAEFSAIPGREGMPGQIRMLKDDDEA